MRSVWLHAVVAAWAVVAGCGDSGSSPDVPGDTVAPRVISLDPVPLAQGVSRSAVVTVVFSEPINTATVGRASFLLRQGFDTVAAAYEFGDSAVTLVPDEQLALQTFYSVTLTRGIRDLAGNQLSSDTAWTFQTAAVVPPAPAMRPPD